jgi:hypothetical protein
VPEMSLLKSICCWQSAVRRPNKGLAVHSQRGNPNSLIFFSKIDRLALHKAVGQHIILINI